MSDPQTTKFRKKPIEIEAFQLTEELVKAHLLDKQTLPFGISIGNWSGHTDRREVYDWRLGIETLEGRMNVSANDWIIRGVAGEYYPCKPDIFEATYDKV